MMVVLVVVVLVLLRVLRLVAQLPVAEQREMMVVMLPQLTMPMLAGVELVRQGQTWV
jgi:hypothetical protein